MRIRLKKMRYGTAVLLPEGSERGKGFREWAAMQDDYGGFLGCTGGNQDFRRLERSVGGRTGIRVAYGVSIG